MKCLTKKGNSIWSGRSICSIISNEKYIGDLLYGKTYTVDPICKKRVVNKGEYDQYYIENHHDPIISKELFEKANEVYERRKVEKRLNIKSEFNDFSGKYPLSKKIVCGFCGGTYTRRSHSQTRTTSKAVWKCHVNIKQGLKYCQDSKCMDDEAIRKAFVEALSLLAESDMNLLNSFMKTLKENIISSNPKSKKEALENAIKYLNIRKNRAIDLMLDGGLTKEEYNKRVYEYSEKIKAKEDEIKHINELEAKQSSIQTKLEQFRELITSNMKINEFDRDVCDAILDKIIIGGYDENGNKQQYLVTIVFDIECSKEVNSDKKYFEIGQFNCNYKFVTFDNNEYGFKTKIPMTSFPVKIALKIK